MPPPPPLCRTSTKTVNTKSFSDAVILRGKQMEIKITEKRKKLNLTLVS
jgi:hypothetical protein